MLKIRTKAKVRLSVRSSRSITSIKTKSLREEVFQLQRKAGDMIDPKELRIGNWVNGMNQNDATPVQIEADLFQGLLDGFYNEEDFEPIPLTEEWLIKLGGKHTDNNPYWFDIGGVIHIGSNSNVELQFFPGDKAVKTRLRIHHVHQLQNLFYALCGEELTIKQGQHNGIL